MLELKRHPALKHSRYAQYLEDLFKDKYHEGVVTCRRTGVELDIKFRDYNYLRKFLAYNDKQLAAIDAPTFRYLEVISILLRRENGSKLRLETLEEFGFGQISHDDRSTELILPLGRYALMPLDDVNSAVPAFIDVTGTDKHAFTLKVWTSLKGEVAEYDESDFLKFGRPPRSNYDEWDGIGYEVSADVLLQTVPEVPPPYICILLCHYQNRMPGTLILSSSSHEEKLREAMVHTPLTKGRYHLRLINGNGYVST